MNLEWLAWPLAILGFAVLFNGWPTFVTINHYHGPEDEE